VSQGVNSDEGACYGAGQGDISLTRAQEAAQARGQGPDPALPTMLTMHSAQRRHLTAEDERWQAHQDSTTQKS
jgi:hypothetical protein